MLDCSPWSYLKAIHQDGLLFLYLLRNQLTGLAWWSWKTNICSLAFRQFSPPEDRAPAITTTAVFGMFGCTVIPNILIHSANITDIKSLYYFLIKIYFIITSSLWKHFKFSLILDKIGNRQKRPVWVRQYNPWGAYRSQAASLYQGESDSMGRHLLHWQRRFEETLELAGQDASYSCSALAAPLSDTEPSPQHPHPIPGAHLHRSHLW